MSSTSSCNSKSKSKRSISKGARAKRSKQDQSSPARSKKCIDLRASFKLSSPSTSNDFQEPSQLESAGFLEPKKTFGACNEVKTSTFSVLKAIHNNGRHNGQPIAEGIEINQSCSSCSCFEVEAFSVPTPSTTDLSEEEVLNIIDKLSAPSFHSKHDCNATVDLRDLELQSDVPVIQHLNDFWLIRKSWGRTDFTQVEDIGVDDVEYINYPYLMDVFSITDLCKARLESASTNSESERVDVVPSTFSLEDDNYPTVGSLERIFENLHSTPSGTITRTAISLQSFNRGRLERLKKFQAGLSTRQDILPSKLFANNNDEEKELNVILRTSDYDLAYAPDHQETREKKCLVPEIECPSSSESNIVGDKRQEKYDINFLRPVNSKFDQNESNDDLVTTPWIKPLVQIYMVKQTKAPAIDTAIDPLEEQGGVVHSDPHTINASSSLEAEKGTVQKTGSVRDVESLSALGGHRRQFDKLRSRPTVQKQLEVTEEKLRLATRSKRYAPPMEIELDEWHSIINVLTMNEPKAVRKVLCRLGKMTTKRVCDLIKFYKCGLFDNLLRLLQDHPNDKFIQNLSLKLVAELSVLPDCRVQLLTCHRLILQCITLLKDDKASLHLQECASKIISAVAMDKVLQLSFLYEHHLVEILLQKIMKTSDPDIRCNCMEIMLRMIKNRPACKRLINCDLFTLNTFRMLLGSEYFKIKQITLGLLVLITRYETEEAFQEKINKSGLPQIMMTILQTEAMCDFYHLVIEILCNIANTVYGLNLLQNSGVIAFLVDYIHTAGKDDLLGCGLDIIVKLSGSPLGRSYLVELKIPARLVKYLKIKDDTILERSCVAISNLSEHLGAVNEMVAEKPAEDLIRLIFEDNVAQIKFAASRAMYELAIRDETMCQYVAELHLTEVFHQIIWSGFTHIQTLSTISDTIQIISHYNNLKHYMINDESMACFLDIIQGYSRKREVSEDLLGGEETLRASALQCLRCYMSEPECRKLFMKASGVYVVRSTLQSPSIRIKQATALFIELAARDPALTKAMVIAGIIPIMVRDTQMKLACPAWEKALNQMYNHHLPSKFAYCNRLDITDITSEGFYVAATQSGEIKVLDNLLNDKKCPMEIIYVCNFASEHPVPDRCDLTKTCPEWHPWQINEVTYPSALEAIEARNMATIWQHKANLLFGDSPDESYDNSLNVSRDGSLSLGQGTISRISSVNRLLKERMNRHGGSLGPLVSYYNLPSVYDHQNNSTDEFSVCPIDHKLRRCLESVRSELFLWLIRDGKYCAGYPYDFVAEAGVVSVAKILAKFVVYRMSGDGKHVPNIASFLNASLWDLKVYFKSSILPLGYLKAGLHLERALLFKVLADKVGLPCTLVRGKFGMAYNEICIPCDNNEFPIPPQKMIPNHVVDLMDHPGRVYFIPSREAFGYCQIPY